MFFFWSVRQCRIHLAFLNQWIMQDLVADLWEEQRFLVLIVLYSLIFVSLKKLEEFVTKKKKPQPLPYPTLQKQTSKKKPTQKIRSTSRIIRKCNLRNNCSLTLTCVFHLKIPSVGFSDWEQTHRFPWDEVFWELKQRQTH